MEVKSNYVTVIGLKINLSFDYGWCGAEHWRR